MDHDKTPVLEAIDQYRRSGDYLRGGVAAGMQLPDASDPKLETFRVVRE